MTRGAQRQPVGIAWLVQGLVRTREGPRFEKVVAGLRRPLLPFCLSVSPTFYREPRISFIQANYYTSGDKIMVTEPKDLISHSRDKAAGHEGEDAVLKEDGLGTDNGDLTEGIQKVENISPLWSNTGLTIAWTRMIFIAIAVSFNAQTVSTYQPYALSAFGTHSMLAAISVALSKKFCNELLLLVKWTGNFKWVVLAGTSIKLIGAGLMLRYSNPEAHLTQIIFCHIISGNGTGMISIVAQTTMQAVARHQGDS